MTATQGSMIPADAPMLEVSGIHSFYGQAHILFDVSLNVRAGEVVVLLGRNGAGKSTTLKSIAGLVRPREGSVRFMGEAIERRQPFEIARRGLGYVPEERRIFTELTVLENLEVGRQPARASVPSWDFEKSANFSPIWPRCPTVQAVGCLAANSRCSRLRAP